MVARKPVLESTRSLLYFITLLSLVPTNTFACVTASLYSKLLGKRRRSLPSSQKTVLLTLTSGTNTASLATAAALSRVLSASGHRVILAANHLGPFVSRSRALKYGCGLKAFYQLRQAPRKGSKQPKGQDILIHKLAEAVHGIVVKENLDKTLSGSEWARVLRKEWENGRLPSFEEVTKKRPASPDLDLQSAYAKIFVEDIRAIAEREKEKIDVWIPLDETPVSPREVFGSEVKVMSLEHDLLMTLRDPLAFSKYVEGLQTVNGREPSVRTPEIKSVNSRAEVLALLGAESSKKAGREFILQPAPSPSEIGDWDSQLLEYSGTKKTRADAHPRKTDCAQKQTERALDALARTKTLVFPMPSMNETYHALSALRISEDHPWYIREIIRGDVYTAHCLVTQGIVRTFVVTKKQLPKRKGVRKAPVMDVWELPDFTGATNQMSGECQTIDPTEPLYWTLLHFTKSFASSLSPNASTPLNLSFIVSSAPTLSGTVSTVYPVGCTTTSNVSVTLLASNSKMAESVAAAYMDGVSSPSEDDDDDDSDYEHLAYGSTGKLPVKYPLPLIAERTSHVIPRGTYSLPSSFFRQIVRPVWNVFSRKGSIGDVGEGVVDFMERVLFWKEELWDPSQPWVWWYEWSVGMPIDVASQWWVGEENSRF